MLLLGSTLNPIFVYYSDMKTRFLWEFIAPESIFHAALVDIRAARAYAMPQHDHDFHELLFVLSGRAIHRTSMSDFEMSPHTLILIRPRDAHSIVVPRGGSLRYLNLAFRSSLWRNFLALATAAEPLESSAVPPHRAVPDEAAAGLRADFECMLRAWHEGATALWPLLQLWSQAVPLLLQHDISAGPSTTGLEYAPDWLRCGADAMRGGANLRGGVTQLQALCGVSAGHLARTLKGQCGQSPREWILARRLERAARLLATTPLAVEEIGRDCGFANSAYFYRTFAREFGQTPRTYRLAARQRVAP